MQTSNRAADKTKGGSLNEIEKPGGPRGEFCCWECLDRGALVPERRWVALVARFVSGTCSYRSSHGRLAVTREPPPSQSPRRRESD
ncbi:hypothetical protein CRG98_024780 [Punica granatum]|uniref:Uncharacterized protein n=1 Tax=Punica granatum TaxID=22663 RepID=A0A2I0JF14_PUNGR|nr:hypothetical protein CRG98_024780 [Punica granatum]